MRHLYLDIETLPSQFPDAQASCESRLKPPATHKKPETISAWEANDRPALGREAWLKTSFNGGEGHVLSIAWAYGDEVVGSLYSEMRPGMNWHETMTSEFNMVEMFAGFLHRNVGEPIIVAHNADFDIRFLFQRAVIHGRHLPKWWPINVPVWNTDKVFCTQAAWAGHRDHISLDRLCGYLGIRGKGDGLDGSQVHQAWLDGRHDEIALYNRADVERVRSIHERLAA